jgi:LPXTG-site transpeptidase (sortase) family protein
MDAGAGPSRFTWWWLLWSIPIMLASWGVWQIGQTLPPVHPVAVFLPPSHPEQVWPANLTSSFLPTLNRAHPVLIVIPSIKVRALVDQVGQRDDGTIETPSYAQSDSAAWYKLGPSPGEPGPTVILGHVDSKKSLAVFFDLKKLKAGDSIEITRADRRVVGYTVDAVELVSKDTFPTRRVYGDTDQSVLRLVTCGGRYDKKSREYLDNVVVFAHLSMIRQP